MRSAASALARSNAPPSVLAVRRLPRPAKLPSCHLLDRVLPPDCLIPGRYGRSPRIAGSRLPLLTSDEVRAYVTSLNEEFRKVSRVPILLIAFAMAPTGALAQSGPPAIQTWVNCLSKGFEASTYTIKSPSAGVYDASIITEGKTVDRYGLLRLKWDQRQVVSLRILESNGGEDTDDNEYILSDIEGYVELKAPWGAWHLESDRAPDLLSVVVQIGAPIHTNSCN